MKLFPFLFFCTVIAYSQNSQQKDSVIYYLSNAKGLKKSTYVKRAFDISKKFKNDSLIGRSSFELGVVLYDEKNVSGIQRLRDNVILPLYKKTKDSIYLAKDYHFRAMVFRLENKLDSSFYYYYKSKSISAAIKDSIEVGRRCLSMSYMQKDGKDYSGAEATIVEGLRYLEPLNENIFTPDAYNSLGHILLKTRKYKEAISYYRKALSTVRKSGSKESIEDWRILINNNVGYTYLVQDRAKEALPYFKEGLSYEKVEIKYPYYYQLLLGNYSDANYLLGNTKEAWKDFWKLLRFREKNNNVFGQGVSHNGFAYYFMREGNNKKALYHARKSYELTKKVNNNFTRSSVLIKLANLTRGKESKKYMNEYIALNDSLRNIELNLKNDFTKIRYETEKKEQENKTLKIDNDRKAAEVQKAKQQRIIGWLVAIALFLTLGLSATFYRNRRKKLLYESQLEKANAREHERQQIAKSLHDEVAGDLRMLHQKLAGSDQKEEADGLEKIKENVRNLSHQLSSVSFEEVSFKDQMINLATDYFSKDFKVFMKGLDNDDWNTVNETVKRTLYLSVRESIQNAIKYAKASRFDVLFALEKKQVTVIAKDDGVGFTAEKGSKGIGLKNMEERVQELRGQLNIKSSEKGTVIEISIPQNGK